MALVAIPMTSAINTNGTYFSDQETIYIDMSGFTSWLTEGGAKLRVFTYYGDSQNSDNWNVENNKNDSDINNAAGIANAIVPENVTGNIYKFKVNGNKVGAIKVIRASSDLSTTWNSSGFMLATSKGTNNCIKITGWDSASWSSYSVSPSPGPVGSNFYTAEPSQAIKNDKDLFTIDARFFDFFTDDEISKGWRNNSFTTSHGDWEPYETFNKAIASEARSNSTKYPIYFGNFFDKGDGYKSDQGFYNFSNWVNNSSRLGDYHHAVINLAKRNLLGSSKFSSRKLAYYDGAEMPFFDADWLTSKGLGAVVDTKFPMRKVVENGVTHYRFKSTDDNNNQTSMDNVWFTGYGNSNNKLTMNYGYGSNYAMYDASSYYDAGANHPGFFPFDYRSSRGTEHTNDAYDFGFGMRVDIPFNVGEGGVMTGDDGSDVSQIFEFTGDDDVWVYVDGVLVLDLGGDHKQSHGKIDFKTLTATVDTGTNDIQTGRISDERTVPFPSNAFSGKNFDNTDPTAQHTLTMFYLERGMVESNLSFEFNFAPLGSNYIVTEKINTTDVNKGLADDVTALDSFTFTPSEKDTDGQTVTWPKGLTYKIGSKEYKDTGRNYFTLGSGGSVSIPNFFNVGNDIAVKQTHGDSVLKYNTSWVYKDKVNDTVLQKVDNVSAGTKENTTEYFTLVDTSTNDIYDFAELEVDFVNTPEVADVVIPKEAVDFIGQKLETGDLYEDEEFDATVSIDFGGKNGPLYNFEYTASDMSGTQTADNGKIKLKNNRDITIKNVPIGATVSVTEASSDHYDDPKYSVLEGEVTEDGLEITVTNPRIKPGDAELVIGVNKTIEVNGHDVYKNSANLSNGYEFKLKDGETVIDTQTVKNDTSSGSVTFKKIVYTIDSTKTSDTVKYVYIDPETFKNGGTKTFTYTVTETKDNEGVIEYPTDYEVQVEVSYDKKTNKLTTNYDKDAGRTDADIVNKVKTGDVVITKTVVNQDGSALTDDQKNKEFDANITISYKDSTFSELPYYYTVSDNGSSRLERLGNSESVKLKHGRTITLSGLPVGTTVEISEVADSEYAVSYSPSSRQVTVNEESASLSIGVTNTRQAPGSATLAIKKNFVNSDVAEKAGVTVGNAGFTFELKETGEGAVYSEKVVADSDTVIFPAIKFESAGTRYFTIKEVAPAATVDNVTYDFDTVYTVEVTAAKKASGENGLDITNIVYKDAEGNVVYSVQNSDTVDTSKADFPAITNKYNAGKVRVIKSIVGGDSSENTRFPIKVEVKYPGSSDFTEYEPSIAKTVSAGADGSYVTGLLPIGTEVRITETDAKGYMSFNGTGKGNTGVVTVTSDPTEVEYTITNQKVEVVLEAQKELKGDNIADYDKQFSFTLTGKNNAPMPAASSTAVNNAEGKITFDKITYTAEGTYEYTISENSGSDSEMLYDGKSIDVTVNVKWNDTARKYETEVKYNGGSDVPVFTNQKTGSIKITKLVVTDTGTSYNPGKDFTFSGTVMFKFPDGSGEYVGDFSTYDLYYYEEQIDGGSPSAPVKMTDGKITLKKDYVITISGLPVGTQVLVKEDNYDDYTAIYSTGEENQAVLTVGGTSDLTITNKLKPTEPDKKSFVAVKTLTRNAADIGGITFENSVFKFELRDAEGNVLQTKTANSSGMVTFDAISYAEADKEYHYTITELDAHSTNDAELAANDTNIIYSKNVYDVVVKTETKYDENGNAYVYVNDPVYTLQGGETSASAVFENDYKLGKATVEKELKGLETLSEEIKAKLSFDVTVSFIYPDGFKGTKLDPQTVTFNNTNGWSKTFDNLPVGTQISVAENDSKGFEVSYAPQTDTVKDGTDAYVKVINTRPEPGSTTAVIMAKKVVEGSSTMGTYNFNITGPGLADDAVYTNDASGNVVSDTITYKLRTGTETVDAHTVVLENKDFTDNVATLTYTVKEIAGDDDTIIYDGRTFKAVVTVTKTETESTTTLASNIKYFVVEDGTDVAVDSITITNVKTGKAAFKKVALDINGQEFVPDVKFGFLVEVSTDGSEQGYEKYADVEIKAGETYEIPEGLPVGTKVRVTETNAQGFNNAQKVQEITVKEATESEPVALITVTNERPQPGATSITLSASKTLTGAAVSEGDFSFSISGPGVDSTKTYLNDQYGNVTFDNINYKYTKGDEQSSGDTVVLHDSDFTDGKAQLTYTIKENNTGNTDVVYDDTEYKALVTITKVETASDISLSSDVSYYKGDTQVSLPEFNNSIRTGSVTINKINQAGEVVKDVTFALYKVSGDDLTREQVMAITPAASKTTNEEGVVEFTDIALYKSDSSKLSDTDKYQWYCVAEIDPADGYTINGELHFFQLPINESYHLNYSYVNGRIITPTTGGEGMFGFKLAGIILMGLALLSFVCYFVYVKKTAKKRNNRVDK